MQLTREISSAPSCGPRVWLNAHFGALGLHLTLLLPGLGEDDASFGAADLNTSEILILIYMKCNVGTSTLKSGSCLLFFCKGLLTTSRKSTGTLSLQHYLQSGTPNYTHYADEDALARCYAFARLRIRSESVARMEIKPRIVAMGSSPTAARLAMD